MGQTITKDKDRQPILRIFASDFVKDPNEHNCIQQFEPKNGRFVIKLPNIDESDPKLIKMTAKEVRALREYFSCKFIYLSFNCHESVTLRVSCSFPETPKTKEQIAEEALAAAKDGRPVPK